MLRFLQEVDCFHDRGPHEHQWRLSAIRALRDSLMVRQVMPRICRITDIRTGLVFRKQTTSPSTPVHTGSVAFPQGLIRTGATPKREE